MESFSSPLQGDFRKILIPNGLTILFYSFITTRLWMFAPRRQKFSFYLSNRLLRMIADKSIQGISLLSSPLSYSFSLLTFDLVLMDLIWRFGVPIIM